jgi:Ca-activated chloride channel family protein
MLPARESRTILSTLSAVCLRSCAPLMLLLICVLVAQSALPVQAQETQEPRSGDEVLRVNTDLFVFPIRVRDQRPDRTPLTERDLELKDVDRVTAGLTLYHGADRIALLFALDQSGSLRDIVSEQRETALALAGRFGEKSQVAVLRFAERPSLVVPFGKDLSLAREAFAFPVRTNQHTAIFDAALASVQAFSGLPPARSERRIIVLISDGLDNASTSKANAAIAAALPNHVSFYVIHLPLFQPRDGRLVVRSPAKGFRDLAEKTGGKYFLVGNAASALAPGGYDKNNDLTRVFQAIEDDLRSQYLLGFYAGEGARDGRNHRFTIGFPAGVEYQIGYSKYKRTQEFFHQTSPQHALP